MCCCSQEKLPVGHNIIYHAFSFMTVLTCILNNSSLNSIPFGGGGEYALCLNFPENQDRSVAVLSRSHFKETRVLFKFSSGAAFSCAQ